MSQSKPLSSFAPAPPLRLPLLLAAAPAWVDCLVLAALAAAIRSIGLAGLPFWSDEMFTIYWSQLPVSYLLGPGAHIDPTPPTYYLFMHGWISLFGDSPLSVHLPSLILSSLTVPVAYLIAKTLSDRKTALLAGLFVAVNPFLVAYAQEARVYALLCLTDSLAVLGLAAYFRHRAGDSGRVLPWLALFVFTASASVFLHFTSIFLVAAGFLVVALDLLIARPAGLWPVLVWLGIAGVTAALVAPALLLAASLAHGANLAWIPPLSPAQISFFLLSVLVGPNAPPGWPGLCCGGALALVAAGAAWWLRPTRAQAMLLLVLPVLFAALLIAADAVRPILLPRVGILLALLFSILLANCVPRQKFAALRVLAAALVLAAWAVQLSLYVAAPHKEDWNTAAQIAMNQPACSGPLLYVSDDGIALIYHQPALKKRPLYAMPIMAENGQLVAQPFADVQSDILQTTFLHSNFLDIRAAPSFITAHPHTMIVLRQVYAPVINVLPRPTAIGMLRGGLVVACY
jgi:hypothetical protein